MKTVLVTGAIGSGKSAVCAYLASKGFPVYDCDSGCKALYDNVPGLKAEIENVLGVSFDRISVIFEDEVKRDALEAVVLPLLKDDFLRWRNALKGDICFMESATALGKSIFDGLYDRVLMVRASLAERIRRNPKAASRDAIQHFDESRADILITNDGTLEELYGQLDNLKF